MVLKEGGEFYATRWGRLKDIIKAKLLLKGIGTIDLSSSFFMIAFPLF